MAEEQLCYRSEALDGEWERKVIIDDNIGRNDGAAQGEYRRR